MTLTDIIGYLPHGLAAVSNRSIMIHLYGTNNIDAVFDEYRPVLRPMNDLDTEITEKGYNDGKPFVPIIELAKTSWKGVEPYINEDGRCVFTYAGLYFYFSWVKSGLYFRTLSPYDRSQFVRPAHTFFQSDLFDLLHAWHFDYRGLIEKGDAVNVLDLEKNPYE